MESYLPGGLSSRVSTAALITSGNRIQMLLLSSTKSVLTAYCQRYFHKYGYSGLRVGFSMSKLYRCGGARAGYRPFLLNYGNHGNSGDFGNYVGTFSSRYPPAMANRRSGDQAARAGGN